MTHETHERQGKHKSRKILRRPCFFRTKFYIIKVKITFKLIIFHVYIYIFFFKYRIHVYIFYMHVQ